MRAALFILLLLGSCSLTAANIDTLIYRAVERADSLRGADQADKALNVLLALRKNNQFGKASCDARSMLYHKMGVCHYSLDQYKNALSYWRDTALQIRLTCLGRQNKETANSFYAVAMAYRYLGDRKNEGKYVKQALEILESLPAKEVLSLAYNYLQAGSLFDDLEDYGQAIYYYEHAERLYAGIPDLSPEDAIDFAEVKKLLGLTQSKLGKGADGVRSLFAAIELYKKTDKETRERNLAHCYNNLSIAYLSLNDYSNAERYAQMALEINKKLNNTLEISNCFETLGVIKKKQRAYVQALNYLKQSLNLRQLLKNNKLIANSWENMADVYLNQGNLDQAANHYETAIGLLVYGHKQQNSLPPRISASSIIDRPSLLRVLGLQADCWIKKYERKKDVLFLEKAFAFYQAYDTLHIQIRQQFKETGSKYRLMQAAMPVYERAIHTALQLYQSKNNKAYLQEAYLFSAKSKAAVLLEGLQELDAKLKGIPNRLLEQEKSVREKYIQSERQFFESLQLDGASNLDSIRQELFLARRDYDKLIDFFELKYPSYFQLKYAFPNASTVGSLIKKTPKDAAIIEYFIGVKTLYIFKITHSGLEYFKVEKPADFEQKCANFIKNTNGTIAFSAELYTASANTLFDILLKKPLQGLSNDIKRLIVIPDHILLHLSFDALPYRKVQTAEKQLPYLIRKYALSTTYSNQLLFSERNRSLRKKIAYGGFGLEYDDYTLQGFKQLKIAGDTLLKKRSAGRLPNSDDEIAEIANMLDGDAWVNSLATKQAFLQHATQYGVLHLAMHGIVDENAPLNSALIFSRTKDQSEDFILRAAEIYGMDLNAQMAVLSACNTGNGDLAPDGVRSLARAFTHAGCPSMVASLWYAYDGPTREILVSFFKYLKAGKPKDIAMQMAKNDYLDHASPTYIMPEYWSNLTVIGDTSPLQLSQFQSKDLLRFSIVLLGIAGLFWVRRFYYD